jgi:hypothetical protein
VNEELLDILVGMNTRRNVLTFITLIAIPSFLIFFQNCASISPGVSSPAANSQAFHFEGFNKSQLQFASNQVEVQDEVAKADVQGLCGREHKGARLRWAIWAGQDSNQPLSTGESTCGDGRFDLSLNQLDQLVCGDAHMLVVEADWGDSAVTHLIRHCQPFASHAIAPPEGAPAGASCFLEYSPATIAEQPCLKVCFRHNLLVFSQSADRSRCANMAAAGIAGR